MMDDDDWDLHAVVRGCAAASTTTTANDIPSLPSFSSAYDNNDNFRGLREVSRELGSDHAQTPATATATAWATGSISVPAAHDVFDQPRQNIMKILKPPLRMDNLHSQENIQFSNPGIGSSSSHNLPATNPRPNRQRRIRKNQLMMKIVRQMTQEELSADSWAWRKYGQKPIKGSAYPRNYYRCSTAKGCAARKQVESSPNNPGIFVVSYIGEHTHPRPTHRSSLSGRTRTKLSLSSQLFAPAENNNSNNHNNWLFSQYESLNTYSSSPSSYSPSTPLAAAENDYMEMGGEEDGGGRVEDDDGVFMIPNNLMNDGDQNIFKGIIDSDDHSSGGGPICFRVVC